MGRPVATVQVPAAVRRGSILVSPKYADEIAIARRAVTKQNPEFTQWLRAAKANGVANAGPAPVEEFVASGRVTAGPYTGYHWFPRNAPIIAANEADERTCPSAERLTLQVQLREFQDEAVDALTWDQEGCVVAPCGAGKTTIGIGLIARLETPALVLVHTKDLLQQWVERCEYQLGCRPTIVGDGKSQGPGRITVATIQTLVSWPWHELDAFGAQFGLVVLDESHHAPARTFTSVMAGLPAKYRLGLTATPERADGLTAIMYWCCGDTSYEVDRQYLVEQGYTLEPDIQWVYTGYDHRLKPEDYRSHHIYLNEVDKAIASDDDRNQVVVDTIDQLVEAGHRVLVLCKRVNHAERLASWVGRHAAAMHGGMTRKQRQAILDNIASGTRKVVVSTSLFDEAIDVVSLSAVVLAVPSSNSSKVEQRIGRILRPQPGKQPIVKDLVDESSRSSASARRRLYRKLGWNPPPLK